MSRAYYNDTISGFRNTSADNVLGQLAKANQFDLSQTQLGAWLQEIEILHSALATFNGSIYFEYSIPRMGSRIDVVLIIEAVIFVLEFKVGEGEFTAGAIDQVWDYALDLKNFHESSHKQFIAPILIATKARPLVQSIATTQHGDKLLYPIRSNAQMLGTYIQQVLDFADHGQINPKDWEQGRYCPTPTIVEAATALYRGHSVSGISRSDASATNLSRTSETIATIIKESRQNSYKSICLVTGVPGAGKTLVGLNIATTHIDKTSELRSVFLSGNGPLVAILREALARDKVKQEKLRGQKIKKKEVLGAVKAFIQNVHNFRDECLNDFNKPPVEHVSIFDEAQRAWNLEQTAKFMRQKRGQANFAQSEPHFLISCMDRHPDWATIVCLVGGGQEINTGEAGIQAWIDAIRTSFPHWHVFISSRLNDSEYCAGRALEELRAHPKLQLSDDLHLAVSMRSFRAEHVSSLVKHLLDLNIAEARKALELVRDKYPIVITRKLTSAKNWLREQARGTERYGIIVSSEAQRLKPEAIDVRSPIDPVHWFLDDKEDVRSSYYLEDVATEFQVQGLELDWACVTWDADFRYAEDHWDHWSFCGSRWNRIKKEARQIYQKNAYRVLLTRARQGMVVVVPEGDRSDPTRAPMFYDATFQYLKDIGFEAID